MELKTHPTKNHLKINLETDQVEEEATSRTVTCLSNSLFSQSTIIPRISIQTDHLAPITGLPQNLRMATNSMMLTANKMEILNNFRLITAQIWTITKLTTEIR